MFAVASVSRVLSRVIRAPASFRIRLAAQSTSLSEGYASHACSRLVSAYAGFPKDLAYGVSNVNDSGNFGHDASFVASSLHADVVGVADGVGGWQVYGVDPSKFSQALMTKCADLVQEEAFNPKQPAQLLSDSYAAIRDSDDIVGSSTACVVILEKASSLLFSANLGDSGFLVYRPSLKRVVAMSEEQTHAFNTPYQLSCVPSESRPRLGGFLNDSPLEARVDNFKVENGDLVLVATDGLFDNVPLDLICSELGKLGENPDKQQIQEVVNSISLQARRLSIDEGFMSPFSEKAIDHGYPEAEARGGKIDDITVVLSVVFKE